jgi:hypothetical protein
MPLGDWPIFTASAEPDQAAARLSNSTTTRARKNRPPSTDFETL